MINQYGDENKSCAALQQEMSFAESEISRLIPKTHKTGKNVALGVAGWFLLVPWFFMDLTQSEQEEINALRQRYNHLAIIATDKGCSGKVEQIPDFKNQKEFGAYIKRLQEREGISTDEIVTPKEMSLEEAKAKVAELEAKSSTPQPKNT
jgi:hypothetical protein